MCFWKYLLEEYPNGFNGENWDYKSISKNICFNCIKAFRHIDWSNTSIGLRDDLPNEISRTPENTFVLHLGDGVDIILHRRSLLYNKNLPWTLIENHPDVFNPHMPLIRNILLKHKSLPLDYIETHVKNLIMSNTDMKILSKNPNITKEFVTKYPDGLNGYPWDLQGLAKHPPSDAPFDNIGDPRYILRRVLVQKEVLPFDFWRTSGIKPSYLYVSGYLTWDFVLDHPNVFSGKNWSAIELSKQKWAIDSDKDRFARQKIAL